MKEPQQEMSFLQHLEILRWHVIRAIVAVLAIAVLAFIFKDYIFDYVILAPKKGTFPTYRFFCQLGHFLGIESDFCAESLPFVIQNRTMTGQFSASLWISIWVGIVLGFPYLVYEIWKFIEPGLYPQEKKMAKGFIFVTSLLFFMGVLFGYYIISPLSIHFFTNFFVSKDNSVVNSIDMSSYIDMVRSSVLSCGLVFELPIVVYFLSKVGILSPEFMRKYRKHAIVLTLLLAALITPPDVASQIIVSIPIVMLYELSIYVSKYVSKSN